jgi:zinc/manganese transport system substrate-binding protein
MILNSRARGDSIMKQVLRFAFGAVILATVVILTACGGVTAPAPTPTSETAQPLLAPTSAVATKTGKVKVIATFSILGDFVHNIAGDKVDLETLVGLGSDVHEFEPSPSDAENLLNASVIIENGLGMESWLDMLYQSSHSQATRIVASAGIPTRKLAEDGKEETDPHIWQDVTNAITMVQNIRDGLMKADPPNAQAYEANANAYFAQLTALDKEIMAEVNRLPADSRKLVTSHDALGYFADRYGFKIIGSLLGTVATASGDPSAKVFAQLVNDIKAARVKAVFVESVANPANMDRLAMEAGVKIGPELYTDSLGPAGSEGATYLAAMRHNAKAIVSALLGE